MNDLVGQLANLVVLRSRMDGADTFRRLLRNVRETCMMAFMHQDFPFPLLLERVAHFRDPSRTPLFQVREEVLIGCLEVLNRLLQRRSSRCFSLSTSRTVCYVVLRAVYYNNAFFLTFSLSDLLSFQVLFSLNQSYQDTTAESSSIAAETGQTLKIGKDLHTMTTFLLYYDD
jgi:hypothetical protein